MMWSRVYSIQSTTFDLLLMAGLGVLGYVLGKLNVPLSPPILALYRARCWSNICAGRSPSVTEKSGSCGKTISASYCQILLVLAVLVIALPPLLHRLRHGRALLRQGNKKPKGPEGPFLLG